MRPHHRLMSSASIAMYHYQRISWQHMLEVYDIEPAQRRPYKMELELSGVH